jgi:hypothetical protein
VELRAGRALDRIPQEVLFDRIRPATSRAGKNQGDDEAKGSPEAQLVAAIPPEGASKGALKVIPVSGPY